MTTYAEALKNARGALLRHKCEGADPEREALELLAFVSGLGKEKITAEADSVLNRDLEKKLNKFIARRISHEPLAYILRTARFMGREFVVTKHTLIPRPATETLYENAKKAVVDPATTSVIDVGTGSGCIAVSSAADFPGAKVFATDLSDAALDVAAGSAKRHGVNSMISFFKDDLIDRSRYRINTGAAVIIANLPYIPSAKMETLDPDARLYEPRAALDGGEDGLDLYRRLLDQVADWPDRPETLHIFMEILPEQYDPLTEIVEQKNSGAGREKILNDQNVCIGMSVTIPGGLFKA